jgi:hypothetical protein
VVHWFMTICAGLMGAFSKNNQLKLVYLIYARYQIVMYTLMQLMEELSEYNDLIIFGVTSTVSNLRYQFLKNVQA